MTVAGERPWLQFGPRSSVLRRDLGPVAWVVLQELVVARAFRPPGTLVETSTRSLAASLGLARDVVARAVGRLAEAGLIERDRQRHTDTGRFASGRYRLDERALADVLIVVAQRGHGRRRRAATHGQGRLFEREALE